MAFPRSKVCPGIAAVLLAAAACAAAAGSPVDSILSVAVEQRAKMNFLLHCAGCHQSDGTGAPGVVPNLGDYLGVFAQDKDARSFPARVPGASSAPISDDDLAEVLNWILITMNRSQLHDDFAPYTGAEVGRYRRHPLVDVLTVRDRLIERIHGTDTGHGATSP